MCAERDKYVLSEEMVSDYNNMEVQIAVVFIPKHAQERKESFYAKTKVRAFVNFGIDRLKKKKKIIGSLGIFCVSL